jgi:hypothetical protein
METTIRPAINEANYKKASLEMYQNDVVRVWPTNMTERPTLYIWLHVLRHATTACEGVRKYEWNVILDELAGLILWWLAFIAKLNSLARSPGDDVIFALPFSASQVVWNKYPRVCPVEFGLYVSGHSTASLDVIWEATADMECTCLARKKDVENRSSEEKLHAREKLYTFAHEFRRRKPKNLSGFEDMIANIFSSSIYILTPHEIAFHLMEEIGEVSRALADLEVSQTATTKSKTHHSTFESERISRVLDLSDELADVFSWTVSLISKVRFFLSSFDDYFESTSDTETSTLANIKALLGRDANRINICDIIWRKYGIGGRIRCPVCRDAPCTCYEENQQLLIGEAIKPWMRKIIAAIDNKLK